MIKCLPLEVQGKLRTGVSIPSLQQCLEELILNSIDAGATCVGVRVDMEAFKLQVIDNGSGMIMEDLDCVGNRYHTSKCNSCEDLENLRWYGFRGEALASIVSLASIVEISSRTKTSGKTHVKVFKDGKGLNVFEAETSRPSPGTTVTICNFFHNMPVRRKRLDAVLEGERIRRWVEAISLMHPSVSFTLRNDCTGVMIIQLPKATSTYYRFIQIHNQTRAEKLGEISYTHKQFEVKGYLGKEGHYNNSLQFVFVNERYVLKTRIHKLLNVLLRRLSSSNPKNDSPDGPSLIRSPKHKRSNELHGIYIINIKCSYSEYDVCLEPAKTLIEFEDWDGVLLCVREAVNTFLKRENLVSMFSQEDLDCTSPRVFCTDRTDRVEDGDKTGQTNLASPALDSNSGLKLASQFVHRKTSDACDCPESGPMDCEAQQVVPEKISTELEETHSFVTPACLNEHDEIDSTPDTGDKRREVVDVTNEQRFTQLKKRKTKLSCETSPVQKVFLPAQANLDSGHILPSIDTRREQTSSGNRKIHLLDSYIHESLQIREQCLDNKPVFLKPNLPAKCEKKIAKLKHKLSLEAIQNRNLGKLCRSFDPVIPPKISRVSYCQKLSTGPELSSLDKFRRAFAKSNQVKACQSQNKARLPERNNFQTFIAKEDHQKIHLQKIQEGKQKHNCIQSSSTLPSNKNTNESETSLASKLCHLKQNKVENPEVSLQISKSNPDDDCLCSDDVGNKDGDENSKDSVVHNESVSGSDIKAGNEGDSTVSDWIPHYDASVGKTVYVNRMTGLSRYEDPSKEETYVQCTSDVTNLAVDVISEMGMEYRCYPFQMDVVLPFLPKSRPERVISSGTDHKGYSSESFNSLSSLYSEWNNPVFVRPPTVGVDISTGQADGLVVKIHNILFPYRFSKTMIHSMKVIHQVDKKFLACLINTKDQEDSEVDSKTEGNLLVLVDQHAAHERVRLENLISDSYEEDPDAPGEKRLCSSTIIPPLEISVSKEELSLLRSCLSYLRSLGLGVTFSQGETSQVYVGKVPLCFMEKESNELKRGRPSVIKSIVEEYIQEQIELLRCTGRVRGTLPPTVLKVLASLACHGAIKFNDTLSRDECCSLVACLSSCQLPFQCAHGRPSIAPLVDILHLDNDQKDSQKPNLKKLRREQKAWELFGKK